MLFQRIVAAIKERNEPDQDGARPELLRVLQENLGREEEDDRVDQVVSWLEKEGHLEGLGLDEDQANEIIRSIIVDRKFPQALINDDELRRTLVKEAALKAADGASPLTRDEAKKAKDLILTREVFRDAAYSITTIFSLVANPERFSDPRGRLRKSLKSITDLPSALRDDLGPKAIFGRVSAQLELVRSGQKPNDPEILKNTMNAVYDVPVVEDALDTVNALLAPENESLRLALLVYARVNGVNLEDKDIDKIRETVLDSDNSDLGALLTYGVKNAPRLAF